MDNDFLTDILVHKRQLNKEKTPFYNQIKKKINESQYSRYSTFKKILARPGINLIAEIKKASPSKGIIRDDFLVDQIAMVYEQNGAAALSILTEEKYFLGKPTFLKQVSECVNLPLLMKDFFIDEGQIYEAFFLGASAILLIMVILTDDEVKRFKDIATSLDLDCLVEVHNQEELDRAIKCEAEIIGVNNRDLVTFNVDIKTSELLIPQIPDGVVKVAESGLATHDDIRRLEKIGTNAVLIGETFMREKNIGAKVKEVMHGTN